MDPLKDALVELARELNRAGITPMLAGGFGLWLKQLQLEQLAANGQGQQTLIDVPLWPPARTTEDIDLLLETEIIASVDQAATIRQVLDKLGYDSEVPNMQFVRRRNGAEVKIDLLTGDPGSSTLQDRLDRTRPPRVKPKGGTGLHARETPEALDSATGAVEVTVTSRSGTIANVRIAGAFAVLLMKLHATRDRLDRGQLDLADKHTADLYRVVAMLSRDEYDTLVQIANDRRVHPRVVDAREIVERLFGSPDAPGTLGLRRYMRAGRHNLPDEQLSSFLKLLHDVFAV